MINLRLRNIDLVKGILVILVISGHVLQGSILENIWRYIIYSFHMPVFIGISGYLFNYSKTAHISFKELILKYTFRIIIPWIIAVIIYMLLLKTFTNSNGVKILISSFVHPEYHLWFIPGFLSWIFITWFGKKLDISIKWLLFISGIISLISFILNKYPLIYENILVSNSFIEVVLYTFRPYFYVFFVFGIYINSNQIPIKLELNLFIALASFLGIILLFFFPNIIAYIVLFFLFNVSFLYILIRISIQDLLPYSRRIEWIGINSLGIYLWHVIPILVSKNLIGTEKLVPFYSLTILLEIVFIIFIIQITKIKFIDKYILSLS